MTPTAPTCTVVQDICTTLRSPHQSEATSPSRRKGGDNARRLLLLQTTLRLIADDGIDAVTHRSVADAANVPLGSTTYWFSSRQEMLREALEYFARLEIETLNERLDAVLGKRLSRRQLVDEFADLLMAQLGRAALAHRRPVRAASGGRAASRARGRLP